VLARFLEHGDHLLAAHARKSFEKLLNRIPSLQMIEEALHWHTRSRKHRLAPENLRIMTHNTHGGSVTERRFIANAVLASIVPTAQP
jgi:hypothetical protein